MRVIRWQAALLVLVVAAVGASAFVAAAASGSGDSTEAPRVTLEGLLKEGGMEYIETSDGAFKVIVTMEEETVLVMAREEALAGDPGLPLAFLYTCVLQMPEGGQPSRAMLKKMAELNDTLLVGNLSFGQDAVFYNSSFWLKNADADTLSVELVLAHSIRGAARTELRPFVEEE
jgi:hypothetical protein